MVDRDRGPLPNRYVNTLDTIRLQVSNRRSGTPGAARLEIRMTKWHATVTVEFEGDIVADSEHEAEQLAMNSWADDHSQPLIYVAVDEVKVEEIEIGDNDDNV